MTPKLIYFAERHPTLDRERFRERWREHGRLGMSLPRWRNVRRYTQGDAMEADAVCDGVATVLFRSEAARLAHIADPDGAVTRADEALVFARPVREVAVLTDEIPILPFGSADTALYLRVRRAGGMDAAAFRSWWTADHGPAFAAALQRLDSAAGYCQNPARPDQPGAIADAVDEIATTEVAACLALLRRTAADPRFRQRIAGADWIAVRRTVLYDLDQT